MAKKKNKDWARNANHYRRQARRLLYGHGIEISRSLATNKILQHLVNAGLTEWAKELPKGERDLRSVFAGTIKLHYTKEKYPEPPSDKERRARKKLEKERRAFYETPEWRAVRYAALERSNGCCDCCGNRGSKDTPLYGDHIIPRSIRPDLELEPDNVQILCKDCNLGKSNKYQTDWRG